MTLLDNFVEKTAKVIVRSASARRDNLVRSTYLPQPCRTKVRRCLRQLFKLPRHDSKGWRCNEQIKFQQNCLTELNK